MNWQEVEAMLGRQSWPATKTHWIRSLGVGMQARRWEDEEMCAAIAAVLNRWHEGAYTTAQRRHL